MDLGLSGKRALVMGSSRGLGRACALRLAAEGCRVVLHGRDHAALAEATAAAGAEAALTADLNDPAAMAALPDQAAALLGGLDILVVNGGLLPYGGLDDLEDDDWHAGFQMLLMSAVRVIRAALPLLRQAGGGAIVIIGSATVREPGALLLSNVLRAGVAGLAKSIASDAARDGIRVNVANPGYFLSGRVADRQAAMIAQDGITSAEAARRLAGSEIPLGRLGDPEELAAIVAFLASERAAFVAGANWAADGGAGRSLF